MKKCVEFLQDESGQDLIEYTLLIAFISLSSVAIFSNAGQSVNTVWKDGKNVLSTAVLSSS